MSNLQTIPLWPDDCPNHVELPFGRPRLEIHQPAERSAKPQAAVVLLPGGGYGMNAPHEGTPFAELFAARGIVGIVCWYRVNPHGWPAPYADAARAMRLVRSMADELHIDPDRVGLMGFSAGGHNAANVATNPDMHHDEHDELAGKISARPNRLILGYPVISFVSYVNTGSCNNLLGQGAGPNLRKQFSHELNVTADNPPTFIFHTNADLGVPAENALMFVTALRAKNVPVELHMFEPGQHGVGLAADHPQLRLWPELMLNWLVDWTA